MNLLKHSFFETANVSHTHTTLRCKYSHIILWLWPTVLLLNAIGFGIFYSSQIGNVSYIKIKKNWKALIYNVLLNRARRIHTTYTRIHTLRQIGDWVIQSKIVYLYYYFCFFLLLLNEAKYREFFLLLFCDFVCVILSEHTAEHQVVLRTK